ncbi:hypothetical protein CICLE_v10023980mg [Citrus x clementina]|uniref:Galactose oxidase-like Early set domain-containing protein n=1 Tax=Citrus clementina TaxID=85681 RepID=V4TTJ4_CITCL|nr:hypothetical protein CICLE_v10023980mg [Citrus x clementina]
MDKGKWQLLLNNTGVVAMHMALTHLNTVIMFDQAGVGQSGYRLRHRFNGTSLVSSKTGFILLRISTTIQKVNATLIVGGNPNYRYTFSNVAYPTELRLQGLVLHYMDRRHHNLRPLNVSINCYSSLNSGVKYGGEFSVDFWLERRSSNYVEFTAYEPPFTTHSVSMNQRMFRPRCEGSK